MDRLFDNEGAAPQPPARKRPGPKPKQKEDLDIKVALKESGNLKEFSLLLDDDWAELLDWYCKRRHDSPAAVIAAGLRAHLLPMRERRGAFERWLEDAERRQMDELFSSPAAFDAKPDTSV